MKPNDLVQVKDVMKSEFDLVDGFLTVADALRQANSAIARFPHTQTHQG